jgi:drug/metabolite transporter (DMT)-like permease
MALALCASLLWGTADFLGGTASRRLPAATVVAISQATALVVLLGVAAGTGEYDADPAYAGWAALAAVVGLVALISFYVALAEGTMGVVAPIAPLGVVVPVVIGLIQGDRPEVWQAAGLLVAVLGVVLSSGPELRGGGGTRPLMLAVVAAVGFGAVIVFVAHGARTSTVMTLLVMRATSTVVFAALALAGRVQVGVALTDLRVLVAIGMGDVGANAAMAVASTRGRLSIVAVLSSLYPAVTVLLASSVHHERLQRVQIVGVAGALLGVVLIASG